MTILPTKPVPQTTTRFVTQTPLSGRLSTKAKHIVSASAESDCGEMRGMSTLEPDEIGQEAEFVDDAVDDDEVSPSGPVASRPQGAERARSRVGQS